MICDLENIEGFSDSTSNLGTILSGSPKDSRSHVGNVDDVIDRFIKWEEHFPE